MYCGAGAAGERSLGQKGEMFSTYNNKEFKWKKKKRLKTGFLQLELKNWYFAGPEQSKWQGLEWTRVELSRQRFTSQPAMLFHSPAVTELSCDTMVPSTPVLSTPVWHHNYTVCSFPTPQIGDSRWHWIVSNDRRLTHLKHCLDYANLLVDYLET